MRVKRESFRVLQLHIINLDELFLVYLDRQLLEQTFVFCSDFYVLGVSPQNPGRIFQFAMLPVILTTDLVSRMVSFNFCHCLFYWS